MDKDEQLQKIHTIQLKIAIEIKRICERYNIKYFLIAGTLLGAVRHKGFIPWDDDMDIGMLREDYNKFLKLCKKELPQYLFLQTWDTEKDYPFSYAKIRLNGTRLIENFSKEVRVHQGIFIDIFPFDNVPEGKFKRKIQSKVRFILKRLLWIKKGYGRNMKTDATKKVKYYGCIIILKIFKYTWLMNIYKTVITMYNKSRTSMIVADGSYSYEKESIKSKWVDSLQYINFENEQFLTFKDYEGYLTHLYGNYMELPPEDKRRGHEMIEVDFGNY